MTEPVSDHATLTLVIPTRNRALFLSKVLTYYATMRCPYPILLGDSSDPAGCEQTRQVVESQAGRLQVFYIRQTPGATTVTSTIELLERVETPYAVWCGDDDFLVPMKLQECVAFLDRHSNYALACGDAAEVFVRELPDHSFAIVDVMPGAHKSAEHRAPSRRLLDWARPTIGKNTFSVQRTETIRYSWKKASEAGLDAKAYAPLHELCVNAISILQGQERRLPGLYHVMLRHTQKTAFSGPVDYFHRVTQWDWPTKVAGMMTLLTEEIVRRESVDDAAARRIAETVFINWLIPLLARNRDRKLREHGLLSSAKTVRERLAGVPPIKNIWCLLKGEHAISPASFKNPWSFYYDDFLPIDRILREATSTPSSEAECVERVQTEIVA